MSRSRAAVEVDPDGPPSQSPKVKRSKRPLPAAFRTHHDATCLAYRDGDYDVAEELAIELLSNRPITDVPLLYRAEAHSMLATYQTEEAITHALQAKALYAIIWRSNQKDPVYRRLYEHSIESYNLMVEERRTESTEEDTALNQDPFAIPRSTDRDASTTLQDVSVLAMPTSMDPSLNQEPSVAEQHSSPPATLETSVTQQDNKNHESLIASNEAVRTSDHIERTPTAVANLQAIFVDPEGGYRSGPLEQKTVLPIRSYVSHPGEGQHHPMDAEEIKKDVKDEELSKTIHKTGTRRKRQNWAQVTRRSVKGKPEPTQLR